MVVFKKAMGLSAKMKREQLTSVEQSILQNKIVSWRTNHHAAFFRPRWESFYRVGCPARIPLLLPLW
mgnify:CR=1 FL=1